MYQEAIINPKISVIIPIYNVEKYLAQCLDSVINQTFKDIEIICVNDGSTDNSVNILNDFAKKDNRIKIINQENCGLSATRNNALKEAQGEYIYFVDSDDYIEPNTLQNGMEIFEKYNPDYICFGATAFNENDEVIENVTNMNNYLSIKKTGLFSVNFEDSSSTNIQVWNKIFKNAIIKKYNIYFPENLFFEDIYFFWYYNFVSKTIYYDKKSFYHYRLRTSSIMENLTKDKTYKTGIQHLYNWHKLMLSLAKDKDLFHKNYKHLEKLLKIYTKRTIKMVPEQYSTKIKLLNKKYHKEMNYVNRFS